MENRKTIFCKIEGTLINDINNTIIESVVNKINNAFNDGHIIILTTNKSENMRNKLINKLNSLDIKFSKLLMGLPNGPQISINNYTDNKNHKSYSFSTKQYLGFESNSHEEYLWDYIMNNNIDI